MKCANAFQGVGVNWSCLCSVYTLNHLRDVWKLNKELTDNFADSHLCAQGAALAAPRRASAFDSFPVYSDTETLHA